jgi:hypothetical protein
MPPAPPPLRHVHIYRGGREPARIPLNGAAVAEHVARRPEAIPGLDALDRPGHTTPTPVSFPAPGDRMQAAAAALIRQADGSDQPGP